MNYKRKHHFFSTELSYQHQIYMNKRLNRFSKIESSYPSSIIIHYDRKIKEMPSSSSKKRFSNLNSTISEEQCPTDWDYVDGKCYQVIVKYHFRFNFVL